MNLQTGEMSEKTQIDRLWIFSPVYQTDLDDTVASTHLSLNGGNCHATDHMCWPIGGIGQRRFS